MARKEQLEKRIKAIRAMLKPLRDARLKREARAFKKESQLAKKLADAETIVSGLE